MSEEITKEKAEYYLGNLIDDCDSAISDDPWDFDDLDNWVAMLDSLKCVLEYVSNSQRVKK